jgi:hypothetical protein
MRAASPTPGEAEFLALLKERVSGVDDWYHEDADGTPWMIVSYDFVVANAVRATLRVDFDGHSLRGCWSPAFLNWDDGVRAVGERFDTGPPDGLSAGEVSVREAADLAAAWLLARIAARHGQVAQAPCPAAGRRCTSTES